MVVWTPKTLNDLTLTVSDLISGENTISKDDIRTGFVRYVMTDELNKDGLGACGYRNSADFDSTLVADIIDHITPALTLPANSTQGGWIRINVPQQTKAGKYTGTVTVKANNSTLAELKLNVQVKNVRCLLLPNGLSIWIYGKIHTQYPVTTMWNHSARNIST